MTGPEHYREAEQLLKDARGLTVTVASAKIAEAQVHATLAHAAADALSVAATQAPYLTDAGADWREVLRPPAEVTGS